MRVAVVGAGVAGGIITSALAQIPGIEVLCLERSAPDAHAHAGNGLNVGPNALLALTHVLPDLAAALAAESLPWQRWRACLADGTPLYEIPLEQVADRDGIRIRWSELYRLVRRNALSHTRYDTECRQVHYNGRGHLVLSLVDTHDASAEWQDEFDLVIAADGRYSSLRSHLCGDPEPTHLGVANFRALVDDHSGMAVDDMEQWFNGPRRLIAFRLADGLIYVSGNLPIEPGADVPERYRNAEFLRSAYTEGHPDPDPRLPTLSAAFSAQAEALHWARAQQIPFSYHDAGGRVLFVGDAAHAMCPTLGQGATQAIEDAAALVGLFQVAQEMGCLRPRLLGRAFAALRARRVEYVARLSWKASDSLLLGSDPVASNRRKAGPEYHRELKRLYRDVPTTPDHARAALRVAG